MIFMSFLSGKIMMIVSFPVRVCYENRATYMLIWKRKKHDDCTNMMPININYTHREKLLQKKNIIAMR